MTSPAIASTTWVGFVPTDCVRVTGKDRVDLLHRLSTNDLLPLAKAGTTLSTLFTTAQGRLIDWVTIVAEADALFVITAKGRGARVAAWIDTYTIMEDVRCDDVSAVKTHVAVSGPDALSIAGDIAGTNPSWPGLAAYGPRVELLIDIANVDEVIANLVARGAVKADATVIEALRVTAGVPGAATEYPDEVNPLELRLGPVAVSFRKGCYIGQEVISRLDSYDKVARLLIGFTTPASAHDALAGVTVTGDHDIKLTRDGKPFGRVTSLVPASDGSFIGLAVVKREGVDATTAELVTPTATIAIDVDKRPFFAI